MFHRHHYTHAVIRGKKTDPEIKKLQYKFIRSIRKKEWNSAENLKTIAHQLSFIKGYIDWQEGDDRMGPNEAIDDEVVSNICIIIETIPMNKDVSYSDDLYALSLLPALDKIIFNIDMMQNNPMSGEGDYFIREENIKAFQTLKAIFIARLSLGFGSHGKDYITADNLALLARQNTLISIKKAVAEKKLQVNGGKGGSQKISSDSAREWLVTSIKNRLIPLRTKDQLADLNAFIGLILFNGFHTIVSIAASSKTQPIRIGYGVYVLYDAETNAIIRIGKSSLKEATLPQLIGRASRGGMRPFHCVIFEPQTTNELVALKQSTALEEHLIQAETKLKFDLEADLVEMKREEFKNNLTRQTHYSEEEQREINKLFFCRVRLHKSGFVVIQGSNLKENEIYGSRLGRDAFLFLGEFRRLKIAISLNNNHIYDAHHKELQTSELIQLRKDDGSQQIGTVSWRETNLDDIKAPHDEPYLRGIGSLVERQAEFIKEHGITKDRKLLPIVVADQPEGIELIAGYPTYWAAKDLADIPAKLKNANCLYIDLTLVKELRQIQREREEGLNERQ